MRSARFVWLAVCLLAAAPAMTAEPGSLFGTPGGEPAVPSRFVRFEGLGVGIGVMSGNFGNSLFSFRIAKLSYVSGRFRAGAAFVDMYGNHGDLWAGTLVLALPVHVGFTVWDNPVGTSFFYGNNPDIYVEASCSPWGALLGSEPAARIALCGDADGYGFGLRIETGWVRAFSSHESAFYAGFQIRLVTFGIGF